MSTTPTPDSRRSRIYYPPADQPDLLVNLPTVQAMIGGDSESHVYNRVREGTFPAPVVREPRCTRWRNGDVQKWLRQRAQAAAADPATGRAVITKAKRASEEAQRKRSAADPAQPPPSQPARRQR